MIQTEARICHSLRGECGLKCQCACWNARRAGHSLRGECGLKFISRWLKAHLNKSLSARRVWIEILDHKIRHYNGTSLSARRVWIEIPEVRGFKHKFPDNSHVDICANLHNQGQNVYILLQSIPFNIKQYFQQYFTLKISYTEKCKFTYCFITNSLTQIENLTIIMAQ